MSINTLPLQNTISQNFSQFIDTEQELFDGQFTMGQFILFSVIIILCFLLTIIIPSLIAEYLTRYLSEIDRKKSKKYMKDEKLKQLEKQHARELQRQIKYTLVKPLKNFLRLTIFAVYGLLAFFALGYSFDTPFVYEGYNFSMWQFIVLFVIIIVFILFIKTTLSPLIRVLLYMFIGRSVKKSELNSIHKSLRGPFAYLFALLMIHSALFLGFPNTSTLPFFPLYSLLIKIAAIIIVTYFVTSIVLVIFHVRFTLPRKMDLHATVAMGNLIKVIAFLTAIFIIIAIMGVTPATLSSLALVLAAIGFAIGFGMQNTIANIMAGFALAADKPFIIGDRIRVGGVGRETWGDVVDIGINTTKIRTVEEETVVLPNNYIASNEIWNYTKSSSVIAHTFNVGISYGSNWRLAKKIIIEEAQQHQYVLRKPQPIARIDEFADSSLNLKVWIWIRNALDKDQIRSDLLEKIKDRFDAEGVEIPFPYRTVVFKKDIPKEKSLPVGVKFDNVRRYPSKGRDYFEVGEGQLKGLPVSKVVHEEDVKILAPVSGLHNAKRLAEYSMSLARKVNGNVTALFIMSDDSKKKELIGLKSLSLFEKYGAKYDINVATKLERGDVIHKILEIIEKDRINLVVIGGARKGILGKWGRESIASVIVERSTVPVVTMPMELKWQ